tara:strand:- start:444 stop:1235 length:792 start_codon:yes stop_codon:yes gene_type:complete
MATYTIGTGETYETLTLAEASLTLPEAGGTIYNITGTVVDSITLSDANYSNGLIVNAKAGEEADGRTNGANLNGTITVNVVSTFNNLNIAKFNNQGSSEQIDCNNCDFGNGVIGGNIYSWGGASFALNTNCILRDASGSNASSNFQNVNVLFNSCTSIGANSNGFRRCRVSNSLALQNSPDFNGLMTGSDYIASGDSTATTTNAFTGRTTSDLVDYAGGDYNLALGSGMTGAGAGGVNIGAVLAAASGASIIPQIMHHRRQMQ